MRRPTGVSAVADHPGAKPTGTSSSSTRACSTRHSSPTGPRWRLSDRPPRGETEARPLRLHPDEPDLHHRWADLPQPRPLQGILPAIDVGRSVSASAARPNFRLPRGRGRPAQYQFGKPSSSPASERASMRHQHKLTAGSGYQAEAAKCDPSVEEQIAVLLAAVRAHSTGSAEVTGLRAGAARRRASAGTLRGSAAVRRSTTPISRIETVARRAVYLELGDEEAADPDGDD